MKAKRLVTLLHEGHEQTEAAGPELFVVSVVGFLVVAAALGYAVTQYAGA